MSEKDQPVMSFMAGCLFKETLGLKLLTVPLPNLIMWQYN